MKLLDQSAQTNWKFIAIVAFVAVFLAGGILMLIPQFEELLPSLSPSVISSPNGNDSNSQVLDTSEWQTYRNDEFEFEVRYPAGWFFHVEEESEDFNRIIIYDNDILIDIAAAPRFGHSLQESIAGAYNFTQDPQFKQYVGTRIVQEVMETTIGNEPALVRITKWGPPAPPDFPPEPIGYEGDVIWATEERIEHDSFIVHGEFRYSIAVAFDGGNLNQEKEIYNQILSTFRFVE